MPWLLFTIALIAALILGRRLARLRRVIGQLEDAARANQRLLPEASDAALQALGAAGLIRELNIAIDRGNAMAAESAGYSNQAEAMLRTVQEVIIVFNAERRVEFANRAAERLFRGGQSLDGLRLDSIMRSLSLLELLEDVSSEPRQIQIEQGDETLWFEASCTAILAGAHSPAAPLPKRRLLVLHEITQLKRLEVMRRDFVANVSHELRTPLTIIKGFAETLVDDDDELDPESRKRFTGKIVANSERLNVLVEDLLTLSRLESKPDQLDPTVQSFKSLLDDAIESYGSRIDPGRQRIELNYDERVGDFAFDRFRINQVLDNLVENAFRYAPDFSRLVLDVQLDEDAGQVVCAVTDDGPGIPEKDIPHVFERFYRVDKGRSRERGGTGLGLSIVKHIIQIHGGTVHAERGNAGGTRIVFTLPYRQKS